MNIKIIIGMVLVGLLGLGLYFLNTQKSNTPIIPTQDITEQDEVSTNSESKTAEVIEVREDRPVLDGPEGWVSYWNDEWGVAFMYPPEWELLVLTEKNLISLVGDGYKIKIHKGGSGLPEAAWTNPEYTVGGRTAKAWQAEAVNSNGFRQVIGVDDIYFWIWTPDQTKKISDEILSTAIFY